MLKLPSVGAHYDMGVDIGNIKNRKNIYIYTSSPYLSNGKKPSKISWIAEVPKHTSLKFQVRTASSKENLMKAEWIGSQEAGSFFTKSGEAIHSVSSNWIQYRALFDTGNGADTPILSEVKIQFE